MRRALPSIVIGLFIGAASARGEDAPRKKVLRCTVPTPINWESQNVLGAYKTAAKVGDWVCLPDPVEWWHGTSESFQESDVFKALPWRKAVLGEHSLKVFVQFDPYPPPRKGRLQPKLPSRLSTNSFANPAVREAFVAETLARVQWYDARFVCLAMEINAYYEEQPDDFDNFVALFVEARRAIKKDRPDAIVFVSFQYEQLLGKAAALTGKPHAPHWELLQKFESLQDAVGISSYPQLGGFRKPSDIPPDYYDQLRKHTKLPIVFTEIGWTTASSHGGSAESQAEFLRRFENMTAKLDLLLVNHFFLYDNEAFGEFFSRMGLLDGNGTPRPAYAVWRSMWR